MQIMDARCVRLDAEPYEALGPTNTIKYSRDKVPFMYQKRFRLTTVTIIFVFSVRRSTIINITFF